MAETKKIPCRVCKKLFVPCAYCQSHSDVFRWRNFACSRECATKYIDDTIAYRESLKNKDNEVSEKVEVVSEEISVKEPITTRKKNIKKISTVVEDEIENKETE